MSKVPKGRRQDVLQAMVDGYATDVDIAKHLGITPRQVSNDILAIRDRIGAADRTQMIIKALRRGIVKL